MDRSKTGKVILAPKAKGLQTAKALLASLPIIRTKKIVRL